MDADVEMNFEERAPPYFTWTENSLPLSTGGSGTISSASSSLLSRREWDDIALESEQQLEKRQTTSEIIDEMDE